MHWLVYGADSANDVQNQTTCYPYTLTRQRKTGHVNVVNEIDKQWPPAYKQHITWLDSYKKKQRRGGSWSSREINFTYYFYCIKPCEVLTFRQAILFFDIISRTELLEEETVVNTPKQ